MATTDQLIIEIKASTQKLEQALGRVEGKLGKTEKKASSLKNALKVAAGALATIGAANLINQVIQTTREFEDLEATLVAVTGSAESAAASFDLVRKFTAQTTFQIQDVASAFITLKNAGIQPTSDVMRDFGNLAAGMGRGITQLAQAAFNATTGEMEMLKQFGIIARVEGDKLRVTFKGQSELIDRNADAIIDKIRSIGATSFSTGIESRFNTLSGAISNLRDSISEFFVAIGDAGLKDELTQFSRRLTKALNESDGLAKAIGETLTVAFRVVTEPLIFLMENLRVFIGLLGASATIAIINNYASLVTVFNTLGKAIKNAAIASGLLSSFTGGPAKALANLAAGTAVYFGIQAMLPDAIEETEEATDGLKEADEALEEATNELVSANKFLEGAIIDVAKAMREQKRETPTMHELVRNFGTVENALEKVNEQFDNFRNSRVDQAVKNFVGPVRNLMDVFGGLEGTTEFLDSLENSFFFENFGMDREAFKRNLRLAFIDGVDGAMSAVQEFMQQQDDPFGTKAINEILGDENKLADFYAEGREQGLFFGKTIDDVRQGLVDYRDEAEKTEETDPFKNLKGIDKLIFDTVQDMAFGMDALKQGLDDLTDEQLLDRINALGINFEELGLNAEDVVPVIRELTAESKDLNDLLEDLDPVLENIAEAFELINTALANGDISLETAVAAYRRFLRATGPVGEAMAEIGTEIESAATALSDELVNALLEGEDALDAFDNFAKKVVQSVISSFMDLLVIQPIVDAILGAFKIPNSSGSGIDTNASGGAVYGGQPTIVGERGPELFVPHSHGKIVNAHNTRGMGGGTVVVNQSINFATGIVPTVRAEVMGMLPQIAEVTKSAVADEAQRGGNFKRMLVGRS